MDSIRSINPPTYNFVLLASLTCTGVISAGDANSAESMDYLEIFSEEFPNPVVEMGPTPIAGIHMGVVYDRSDLAEDPFSPPVWILTEDGYREHLTHESVAEALKRVGFVPQNGVQAVHAARLYNNEAEYILGESETDYPLPDVVPSGIRAAIRPPQARKTDYGFEVELWIFGLDSAQGWYERGPASQWLARCRYEIGEGIYRYFPETLWSVR